MNTAFLATALDRIRETQLQHGQTLATIAKQQGMVMRELKRQRRESSQPETWREFFKPIVRTTVLWGAGLLTVAYVLNGGDIVTALNEFRSVYFMTVGR